MPILPVPRLFTSPSGPVAPLGLDMLTSTHGILTAAQVAREGGTRPGSPRAWRRERASVRTVATQHRSVADVTFWARRHLPHGSGGALLHQAAFAEAHVRLEAFQADLFEPVCGVWRPLALAGRHPEEARPDGEVVVDPSLPGLSGRVAVEVDTGYSYAVCHRKIESFAAQGYRRVVFATTVPRRVRSLSAKVALWHADHVSRYYWDHPAGQRPSHLTGLTQVLVVEVQPVTVDYSRSPRNRKRALAELFLSIG